MEITAQKKEIIDWILALENKDIINDVYQLKKEKTAFNFDEAFANGYTIEAFRNEMKNRINKYPMRK